METNNSRFLFITLTVQDGERQHDHRVLHQTKCENIEFAAQMYAAKFWGEPDGQYDGWWDMGDIMIRVDKVKEITEEEYNKLHELFYT